MELSKCSATGCNNPAYPVRHPGAMTDYTVCSMNCLVLLWISLYPKKYEEVRGRSEPNLVFSYAFYGWTPEHPEVMAWYEKGRGDD
jgi:hypothetical protein